MLVALSLSGCASFVAIPYTAQPGRTSNAAEEAKALILANTQIENELGLQSCIVKADSSGATLVVQYDCSRSKGSMVAHFDHLQAVVVEQSGQWFRCRVRHSPGYDDFWWSSKRLEDVERMADAFTALAAH